MSKLSSNSKSELKFQKVMHEFGRGKLQSHGNKVTDQKQAVAIAFSEARKVNPEYGMKKDGGSTTDLQQIYKTGTAKQLWEAWDGGQRMHFILDHIDNQHTPVSKEQAVKTAYQFLPADIKKELAIHHAMGIYKEGAEIPLERKDSKFNDNDIVTDPQHPEYGKGVVSRYDEMFDPRMTITWEKRHMAQVVDKRLHPQTWSRLQIEKMAEGGNVWTPEQKKAVAELDADFEKAVSEKGIKRNSKEASDFWKEGGFKKRMNTIFNKMNNGGPIHPAKQKIQDRINILKETQATASSTAQKAIQSKIDKLQAKLDYNPTAKQRAQDNKGRFAMDVPAKYSKAIYKKLWSMKIMPRIHKMNGTASIVVSSRNNLDKAYKVYSGISSEKVLPLEKISRKL